ncbi:11216_t:CDS:2 [Racocetra fulgida]|uniref:11216_t:CDS:1 n=1 Tax=Racocetra fulgida TaxID=60492 RepID=A0A9N9GR29_9GLOM|nr:11216_t:CDS:2 [Racocetra fulgida]
MAATVKGKWFDRIVLIIFENTNYTDAIANSYLKEITTRPNGVLLSDYHAVEHPSEPNYIAQIAGSTYGILDDENYDIDDETLVDLLEKKGVSWKVVNAKRLDDDIKNNQVPQLVYYVPNQNNDAHDTNISYASAWFKTWLEPKLKMSSFTHKTLFFTVFDESANDNDTVNHIYASLLGDPVTKHNNHNDTTHYTHYSFLRTVEDNWDLGSLNRNDSSATPFSLYLNEQD